MTPVAWPKCNKRYIKSTKSQPLFSFLLFFFFIEKERLENKLFLSKLYCVNLKRWPTSLSIMKTEAAAADVFHSRLHTDLDVGFHRLGQDDIKAIDVVFIQRDGAGCKEGFIQRWVSVLCGVCSPGFVPWNQIHELHFMVTRLAYATDLSPV